MIGIFLDIESNGLDVMKHRVLEIAFKLIDLDSQEELAHFHTKVVHSKSIWQQSDPKSLKINGFTFDDIQEGLEEQDVQEKITTLFSQHKIHRKNAVYICQNPAFDRSFFAQLIDPAIQERLSWPYHWLDLASMFWALTFKKYQKNNSPAPWELGISKNSIAQTLGLPTEQIPHKAMQGVDHLIECYFTLLN